jgi:hypothetical protein
LAINLAGMFLGSLIQLAIHMTGMFLGSLIQLAIYITGMFPRKIPVKLIAN